MAIELNGARFGGGLRETAQMLLWGAVAVVSFHLAYVSAQTGFLAVIYLFALLQLAKADTWRMAFYPALAVGLALGALRLGFFWSIFSAGAVALWLVYAFWIGLFVAMSRLCLRFDWARVLHLPNCPAFGWFLIPFIWCGLEYFRSELYYLRFSWLSPGFVFGSAPSFAPFHFMGAYGTGFLLMAFAWVAAFFWRKLRSISALVLLLGIGFLRLGGLISIQPRDNVPPKILHVAGVQMEFPTEPEVLIRLNELVRRHPEAELLVLSEYTFTEPVPEKVKAWCRQHQRYLAVGGKDPAPGGNFYDTAFVVSPDGEIVFRQGKSVPIQFFKDGLPAPEQKLWDSPWGQLGICVCYDLSYSRVTDRLIRLGAQGLLVPTMDVVDWGEAQHRLHARVAPVRAAEYGVPIFRVASSGISQLVDRDGHVLAEAPCPGEGAIISGTMQLRNPGHLPWDRWLAPFSTGMTALLAALFLLHRLGFRSSGISAVQKLQTEGRAC
ncbi:MAG TPA: nitrilase-related carbon-nitrogen hydrolase [Candidatus Acidoferrum sp.]|nr:nitrilase-related carbon-nitrogen hydrolase [Candidatus Acidoferrum sp.]